MTSHCSASGRYSPSVDSRRSCRLRRNICRVPERSRRAQLCRGEDRAGAEIKQTEGEPAHEMAVSPKLQLSMVLVTTTALRRSLGFPTSRKAMLVKLYGKFVSTSRVAQPSTSLHRDAHRVSSLRQLQSYRHLDTHTPIVVCTAAMSWEQPYTNRDL